MNNLQLFSKLKRRNKSLLVDTPQKFVKTVSEPKRLSPFSRIERPFQLSTLQNSKILPKNIVYDKESLYLEVLSLKMELNQIVDQNIRLKTRIVGLQRQVQMGNQRTSMQEHPIAKLKRNKTEASRINENLLIESLKKMVKEVKKESDSLKAENGQMKKLIKITQVNQLQLQSSMAIDQNRRLAAINQDLQRKLQVYEKKYLSLQKVQLATMEENRHLQQQNVTLRSYIKALQIEQKLDSTSLNVKQRRPIQQFAKDKRKNISQAKPIEEAKKELLLNKEASFRVNKKEHLKAMRVHYNMLPIKKHPNPLIRQFKPQSQIVQASVIVEQNTEETELKPDIQPPENIENSELKPVEPRTNEQSKEVQGPPQQNQVHQARNEQPEVIQNIFQSQQQKQEKQEPKDHQRLQINSLQNEQAASKKKIQKKSQLAVGKAFSEPQQQKIKSKSMYRSNKKIIKEICQLLTYRMIAQRYTFKELKADIEQSPAKEFSYVDLCHMLVNEPFYLTVDYCRALLSFLLEKERPNHNDTITSLALMSKLRKVIKDFECFGEEEEAKIIQNCAFVITQHSKDIKNLCHYQPNDYSTIKHDKLKEILEKLGLGGTEVNIIIGELSICSQDLAHLNLDVLFERFDLNQITSNQQESKIIQQAENDDSLIVSKGKESPKMEGSIRRITGRSHSEQAVSEGKKGSKVQLEPLQP